MSANTDKRRKTREALMQMLYQMEVQGDFSEEAKKSFMERFLEDDSDDKYFEAAFNAYINNNNEIDDLIESYSKGWKLDRLAKVDLSVLRLAVAEMLYLKDGSIPPAVSINEAVELAKSFGTDGSASFVNGILGRIIRSKAKEEDK